MWTAESQALVLHLNGDEVRLRYLNSLRDLLDGRHLTPKDDHSSVYVLGFLGLALSYTRLAPVEPAQSCAAGTSTFFSVCCNCDSLWFLESSALL